MESVDGFDLLEYLFGLGVRVKALRRGGSRSVAGGVERGNIVRFAEVVQRHRRWRKKAVEPWRLQNLFVWRTLVHCGKESWTFMLSKMKEFKEMSNHLFEAILGRRRKILQCHVCHKDHCDSSPGSRQDLVKAGITFLVGQLPKNPPH